MDSRQYAVDSSQHTGTSWGSLLPAAFCLLLAGCSSGPSAPDQGSYVDQLTAARANKDRQFRESPGEPVPADKLDTLLPLRYYPIDHGYSVAAALKLAENRPVFEMPTSTGTLRKYQLVGALEFT